MPMVHQTGQMIWVRCDDGHDYGDTPENFALDFGEGLWLPPDITSREYLPGIRHTLKRGTDVVDGGPMPWPLGDKILEAKLKCEALKKERDEKKWQEYCDEFHAKQQAEIDAFAAKQKALMDEQVRKWAAEARARGMVTPEQYAVAQNDAFMARVARLATAVAHNVIEEDPETADHDARKDFAERVLRGDESPLALASGAVAMSDAIKDKIDAEPAQLGANVPDNDIAFAIASTWTARALLLMNARALALKAVANGNPDQTHADAE